MTRVEELTKAWYAEWFGEEYWRDGGHVAAELSLRKLLRRFVLELDAMQPEKPVSDEQLRELYPEMLASHRRAAVAYGKQAPIRDALREQIKTELES